MRGAASTSSHRCRSVAKAGVVAERAGDEVVQLGHGLDARVAGTDDDEREMGPDSVRLRLGVCVLELAQDVIPQEDAVCKRLLADGVIGQPRDRERSRDRANRDDEVLVGEPLVSDVRVDRHFACLRVDAHRAPENELRVWAHLPEWNDGVARLEGTRGGLG